MLGQALGVFAGLGEAHIAVDHLEPGALHSGLQSTQFALVGVHRHDGHVGLVAEHRNGCHLAAGGFSVLHSSDKGFGVVQRIGFAEQVEHGNTDRGRHCFGRGGDLIAHGTQATQTAP